MQRDADLVRFYRERRAELDPSDGNKWYLLIKELRLENCCSLDEAHRIALADPTWRRWLEQRINTDPMCRKSALRHIRRDGEASLIEQAGDKLKVR
jgi:hypothetical protein